MVVVEMDCCSVMLTKAHYTKYTLSVYNKQTCNVNQWSLSNSINWFYKYSIFIIGI